MSAVGAVHSRAGMNLHSLQASAMRRLMSRTSARAAFVSVTASAVGGSGAARSRAARDVATRKRRAPSAARAPISSAVRPSAAVFSAGDGRKSLIAAARIARASAAAHAW